MSNSPLVSYTKRSPMNSGKRRSKIDTVTIHHMAGNLSVETCGQVFQTRQASANYGVGSDGRIGLYVDEANRSWASASPENDHRAVTIEVANSAAAPDWPVSDRAYAALIELLADICRRNGIAKLVWSKDKADRVAHRNGCNMTVHRDFMATNCPGPYLMARMGDIAAAVNARLAAPDASQGGPFQSYTVRVRNGSFPIRTGPGEQYRRAGNIRPGVYTMVEERDGWGRLKSGAGWIELANTQRT